MIKKKLTKGLSPYFRRKMTAEDISKWINENMEHLLKEKLLLELQPNSEGVYLKPDSTKTVYYLKLELE